MKIHHAIFRSVGFVFTLLVMAAAGAAETASELTIRNTAIQKMLMEELFIDKGRYPLLPETVCQYAFLDSPVVTISQGRVRIKVRLSGQLATQVEGKCVGTADVVQIAVSAQPVLAGVKLVLSDLRIDEVSNELYRILLSQFLQSAIPRTVEIDLREGVQKMFSTRRSSWEVSVEKFSLTELSVENNQLRASLLFSLVAK
ncbi:MAG: hypothetical protein ABL878_16900 [Burkholderiales bacterium]